jgi:hypothetical protein
MTLTLGHTPHIEKQIIKHAITSFATSIILGINYKFAKPQNVLTICVTCRIRPSCYFGQLSDF